MLPRVSKRTGALSLMAGGIASSPNVGSSRAYLCVSIDTECDKGKGWRSRRPMSFEGVRDGVVKRLQPLFAERGAKPTYLLSPEVLRDPQCIETFRALEGSC